MGLLQALVALAERAACDVRSCLNTLQFLAKQGKRVRTTDITSLNMGQKDLGKGAFSIWNQLLSTKVGIFKHLFLARAQPLDCLCRIARVARV